MASEACGEPTTNGQKRYRYRSFDDQLLIVFTTIDFFVPIERWSQIYSGDFVGFDSIFEMVSQIRHYSVDANPCEQNKSSQFPISTIMAQILLAQV
jgi:hypothetical protein